MIVMAHLVVPVVFKEAPVLFEKTPLPEPKLILLLCRVHGVGAAEAGDSDGRRHEPRRQARRKGSVGDHPKPRLQAGLTEVAFLPVLAAARG